MAELSTKEYSRINSSETEEYLTQLLYDVSDSSEFSGDEDDLVRRANSNEFSDEDHYAGEKGISETEDDSKASDYDERSCAQKVAACFEPDAIIATDGTAWHTSPPTPPHTPIQFTFQGEKSGPDPSLSLSQSILDTFRCLFSNEMVSMIVEYTNIKAKGVYEEYNSANPGRDPLTWTDVSAREFDAFLGILVASGANNSNTDHIKDMWKTNSHPLYRASMSLNRFREILRFVRFDDPNTRVERSRSDKLEPIWDLWSMLNGNLVEKYKPSQNLTIDEQMLPCKSQYNVQWKPATRGIRVWWLYDSESFYPLCGHIYSESAQETDHGEEIVKDLVFRFKDSGRNITMDKFLTSLSLAEDLYSWGLTMVGPVKRNKSWVPREMARVKTRQVSSTLFGFRENVTLFSYVPKKNKIIILISTRSHDDVVSESNDQPEIVEFYNRTKPGAEVMDKVLGCYTTRRRTNRWPLASFFNILDVAAFAAYIIFSAKDEKSRMSSSDRRMFLRLLGEELSLPAIQDRYENPHVMRHFSTRSGVECILKQWSSEHEEVVPSSVSAADDTDAQSEIIARNSRRGSESAAGDAEMRSEIIAPISRSGSESAAGDTEAQSEFVAPVSCTRSESAESDADGQSKFAASVSRNESESGDAEVSSSCSSVSQPLVKGRRKNVESRSQSSTRAAKRPRKTSELCYICLSGPPVRRRSTQKQCQNCERPVCGVHSCTIYRCDNCPFET